MKRLLILAMSAAAIVVFSGTASAQDAKVEKGKAVYAASTCKMCHSIGGVGNAKGSLDEVGTKLTAAEIKEWLVDPVAMTAKTKAERKPAMKLTKPLPAEDVDALVAYLSTLKKK
jgi:mono/diheme cytochrome c family protein